MPVTPTYPGVYIQEVDSGSRVVTGVATSITAFVGRADRGPANTPITVFNFGDFEQLFGGLAIDMPMTYAVQDFFDNGGGQAIVVRVLAGAPLEQPAHLDLKSDAPKYTLTALVAGTIGNKLLLRFDKNKKNGQTYDVTLSLGPATDATSTILAKSNTDRADTPDDQRSPGLAPAAVASWLGGLTNLLRADGQLDPKSATTFIEANAGKDVPFVNGAADTSGETPTTPTFIAGDLEIGVNADVQGAWVDDLNLSIAARGTSYVLIADHPMLAQQKEVVFWDWASLKSELAKTGLVTVTKTPTPPAFATRALPPASGTGAAATPATPAATPAATPPAANGAAATTKPAFPGKVVSLVRKPDGQGSSTAMLVLGGLVLTAANEGEWGNKLGVYFDKKNITNHVAMLYSDATGGAGTDDFWNINVVDTTKPKPYPTVETIGPVYLSYEDAPCRIDHVLAVQSSYIRARAPISAPAMTDMNWDATQPSMLTSGRNGSSLTTDMVVGNEALRTGIYALDNADLVNIMVIPPDPMLGGDADMKVIYQKAAKYCADHRAILIADPLEAWGFAAKRSLFSQIQPTDFNIDAITERRVVFTYFPRVKKADPLRRNREMVFPASGMIAGVFASTDVRRGVWKAPAGVEAGLNGVTALEHKLTDMQNGVLNQVGINVLRDFPVIGKVVWGSRTLAGADAMSDDYKYLPVRRLTDYIEESLYRGTKYAVFEPNSEPLWATIRLSIGAFMADLARQGAFYDYYVRCDASTTTSNDINLGKCNVIIAFAPVKPAEFIILTIQQLALKPAA